MKIILNIFYFYILIFCGNFTDDEKVFWHERNEITWDDFTEIDKLSNNKEAIINWGIACEALFYESDNLVCEIKTFVNVDNTFVLKDYPKTNNLLLHEQGHFDIGEIYARKIRKALAGKKFKKEKLNRDFKRITDLFLKECENYQDLYDVETNHSKDTVIQKLWNVKIAKELKQLEKFNNIQATCKVS